MTTSHATEPMQETATIAAAVVHQKEGREAD